MGLMTRLAMRESVTVADRAERARLARAFVSSVLGLRYPCGEEAVLLVSEMFDNDMRRSQSGTAGETITVAVRTGDSAAGSESLAGTGLACPGTVPCRHAVKWSACPGPGVRRRVRRSAAIVRFGWCRRVFGAVEREGRG